MKVLFLDRDGVINVENKNGYILNIEDFLFMDGVLEALSILKKYFDKIVVVTNQRCVGKGLITAEDLEAMHDYMIEMVYKNNGQIDKVYYAPALASDDGYRKPNTGMAQWALRDLKTIQWDVSVMVGNNLSDMQFGKSMGMQTVFLSTTSDPVALPHSLIDLQFDSLWSYAIYLSSNIKD